MSDEFESTTRPNNPLTAVLLDTVKRLRLCRLLLQQSRERHRAVAEALHVSIAMLAAQDREIDQLRDRYHRLLAERRDQQRRAA